MDATCHESLFVPLPAPPSNTPPTSYIILYYFVVVVVVVIILARLKILSCPSSIFRQGKSFVLGAQKGLLFISLINHRQVENANRIREGGGVGVSISFGKKVAN